MVRISLRSILLICIYFAICSSVCVSPNLWVGWFVVLATAIWMSFTIVRAFQTHNHFTLGFAVIGTVWLVAWLGLAIETKTANGSWNIRSKIAIVMNLGREWPDYDPSAPHRTYAHMHDLYYSAPMAIQTSEPVAPTWHNSMRLAVCLSSLAVGVIGGIVFHLIANMRMSNIPTDRDVSPDGG